MEYDQHGQAGAIAEALGDGGEELDVSAAGHRGDRLEAHASFRRGRHEEVRTVSEAEADQHPRWHL
jgi:hypothetical protein